MNNFKFQAVFFFFFSHVLISHQAYHRILHKWIAVDFDYPNVQARNAALQRGEFIPNNVAITDTDYHASSNRYFVAAPLFREGVPATLSQVTEGNGILKPFPSWPNYDDKCRGPFSVFRFYIDKCGLMWVPDSGMEKISQRKNSKLTCPPKLLIYDLNKGNEEILRYEFPDEVLVDVSLLHNVITESYQNDCSDSFAYIADVRGSGMIVFDYKRKKSWRIENEYFHPFSGAETHIGNNITMSAGLTGLALGPPAEGDRKLFFHSLTSFQESWVPLSVLKDKESAQDPSAFILLPGERPGQSVMEVMTDNGIMIYSLLPSNAIACWNSKQPFNIENHHILEKDDEDFQYISGLKLKDNKLLMMSNRYFNYVLGKTDGEDFKYRLMVIDDVNQLLKNTPCARPSSDEL